MSARAQNEVRAFRALMAARFERGPIPRNGPGQRFHTLGFYPPPGSQLPRFPMGEYTAQELVDAGMWRAAEATPYDSNGLWHSRSHP